MFSCEFCEISKSSFSTEHLQTTAFREKWIRLVSAHTLCKCLANIQESQKNSSIHGCSIKNLLSEKFCSFVFFWKKKMLPVSLKKRLRHKLFSVYFRKSFRTPFLQSRGYENICQTKFTMPMMDLFFNVTDLQFTASLYWPRHRYFLGFCEMFQNIRFTEKISVAIGVF